jgi:hypothetical protein
MMLLPTLEMRMQILIAKVDSNVCDASIPNLTNDNVDLLAKIEELNISLDSLRIENEKLLTKAKELDVCNASISNLRSENDILHAKVVELKSCKPSTSTVEHTSCRRFETGGSLSRRVMCRRVPQPRWVDARPSAKGGSEVAGDGCERGGNPAAFVFVPRPGRVRLQ